VRRDPLSLLALGLLLVGCGKHKDADGGYEDPITLTPATCASAVDGETIDLMVVVTHEAILAEISTDTGDTDATYAYVASLVSDINDTLANSCVSHRVNLNAVYSWSDTEADILASHTRSNPEDFTDASLMLNGFANNAHIALRRSSLDADLVLLLAEDVPGGGGIAYVSSGGSSQYTLGFGLVDAHRADSFVHEFGHMLGGRHDVDASSTPCDGTPVPYACGWNEGDVATSSMMAYPCSGCDRVLVYSTPHASFDGYPMGHETDGFNACVVEQLGEQVADYDAMIDDSANAYGITLTTTCELDL
jgi:hypothetical protein